jgi:hypothetical protein
MQSCRLLNQADLMQSTFDRQFPKPKVEGSTPLGTASQINDTRALQAHLGHRNI